MNRIKSNISGNFILFYFVTSLIISIVIGMSLFDVKLIESPDSRLIATSNYNYAISSPRLLSRNWRCASVNGDSIFIITTTGEKISKSRLELPEGDRLFLETLRDEIANSNFGYTHTSMSSGGGGSTMSSLSSQGGGISSSFSSSGGFVSSNMGMGGMMQGNGMSVNMKDFDNFSVSKSSFPFNWSRVFVNGDLVAFVCQDGQVLMNTLNTLEPTQLEVITSLKREIKDFQLGQNQQISGTMQNSMDFISGIFNNIMGNLPKPPSFGSFGNMFGNNFPFGSNNSPFSASSGWPFSTGAFAFAGRRR